MTHKAPNKVVSLLEKIVANPLRATFTVGISILLLQALIHELSNLWPTADYLKYLIPFIPPFFITRTAKRINERRAEYGFIHDAAPLIFIALPNEPSVESLLKCQISMISNSAQRHLNRPVDFLLNQAPLAAEYFATPSGRLDMVQTLVDAFRQNDRLGVLENYHIELLPYGAEKPIPYLMNSVLKRSNGRTKWQATLTSCDQCPKITNC